MATQKTESTDIKKIIANHNLVIGTDRTLKELKKGNLARVLIASNCAQDSKESAKYYCDLSKIPYEELKEDDLEFGILCKKQFSICMAGVLKSK